MCRARARKEKRCRFRLDKPPIEQEGGVSYGICRLQTDNDKVRKATIALIIDDSTPAWLQRRQRQNSTYQPRPLPSLCRGSSLDSMHSSASLLTGKKRINIQPAQHAFTLGINLCKTPPRDHGEKKFSFHFKDMTIIPYHVTLVSKIGCGNRTKN